MINFLAYIFILFFSFTSSVNAGYFIKSESGLTVAGSLYSIQDSARKIYSWVEGEGYKGKTTYVDPISGEVYTSDAMLKDGAVDLATAAAILPDRPACHSELVSESFTCASRPFKRS